MIPKNTTAYIQGVCTCVHNKVCVYIIRCVYITRCVCTANVTHICICYVHLPFFLFHPHPPNHTSPPGCEFLLGNEFNSNLCQLNQTGYASHARMAKLKDQKIVVLYVQQTSLRSSCEARHLHIHMTHMSTHTHTHTHTHTFSMDPVTSQQCTHTDTHAHLLHGPSDQPAVHTHTDTHAHLLQEFSDQPAVHTYTDTHAHLLHEFSG